MNLVVKEGHTKASVTKEFNLSRGLLKTWIDAHRRSIDSSRIELEQRQRELEKENKLLKKENEFQEKQALSLPETKTFAFS